MANITGTLTVEETVITGTLNIAIGPAGPGVPVGGTAGQLLAKVDTADYNTEWVNPAAGGGGGGDMFKATYDTDNSGVVDSAETVNGLTVETAVPVGAVFTDTVYDDSVIQNEVDLNTAKTGITAGQSADILANNAKISATGNELEPGDIDTLAELNAIITDATLIDTNDPRLSDARTPTAHTHTASEITDFDAEVSNNAAVAANTAKVSYTDAAAVSTNTQKVSADGSIATHSDVDITGVSDGEVLTWVNANSRFEPTTPSGGGQGVPTGGTTGQVLSKIDGTDYNTEWADPAAGGGASNVLTAVKEIDESKTNDPTRSADNDFQIAVEANTFYKFEATFYYDAGTTEDISFEFTAPALTSGLYTFLHTNVNNPTYDLFAFFSGAGQGVGTTLVVKIPGYFSTGVNAGMFSVAWAQKTMGANATTLQKGSNLEITKLN